MSQLRLCGVQLSTFGVLAVLLYIIDTSLAQDDQGYAAGDDYPVYNEVPKGLSFTCDDKLPGYYADPETNCQVPKGLSFTCDDKLPGYYADPETNCQVWHWCVPSIGGNIQYSFVCAPGTVFNQRTRVCDWFYKTDCPNSQAYYGINEDLYKDETGNYINGKKGNSYNNNYDRRRFTARRKRHDYMMQQRKRH